MKFKTPGEKVRTYQAFIRRLRIITIVLAAAGLALFAHHDVSLAFTFIITAGISLTTAFASSNSKFAKEVEVIVQFCRERKCDYSDYPTDRVQCDDLREDEGIFLELTNLATVVIDARREVDRRWRMKDLVGEKAAKVNEQNARRVLRERWCFYRRVGSGILPFKNPVSRTEWKDEGEFMETISLGIISVQYNLIGQRYA